MSIDYRNMVLLILRHHPSPSRGSLVSMHRVRDRKGHQKILSKAFKKRCVVYYARVLEDEESGKQVVSYPWVADLESFDALFEMDGTPKVSMPERRKVLKKKPITDKPSETIDKDGIYCPFCTHSVSSTPGRTLHVKSKHPERLEEYKKWLESLGKS